MLKSQRKTSTSLACSVIGHFYKRFWWFTTPFAGWTPSARMSSPLAGSARPSCRLCSTIAPKGLSSEKGNLFDNASKLGQHLSGKLKIMIFLLNDKTGKCVTTLFGCRRLNFIDLFEVADFEGQSIIVDIFHEWRTKFTACHNLLLPPDVVHHVTLNMFKCWFSGVLWDNGLLWLPE